MPDRHLPQRLLHILEGVLWIKAAAGTVLPLAAGEGDFSSRLLSAGASLSCVKAKVVGVSVYTPEKGFVSHACGAIIFPSRK